MVVINDDYRLLKGGRVNEGGLARNEAIITWLKENKSVEELSLNHNRLINALCLIRFLIKVKGEKILFFYPTVGIPVLKNGLLGRICAGLFIKLFKRASKRNDMYMDICDLKYEQALDLDLDIERLKAIRFVERELFSCKCNFIFASRNMRDYAINKYNISSDCCFVLDNGGALDFVDFEIPPCDNRLKLVYAGTLNKGRCIEKMIDEIIMNDNVVLYLCGRGGEWIKESSNIINVGALDEAKAHYLVSKCDIGLIPYDETKPYYNIAYPTKLAFYITAGIPFLSTDVSEVRLIKDNYEIGYISSIDKWCDVVNSIRIDELNKQKSRVEMVKEEFTWDYKCEHSILGKEI